MIVWLLERDMNKPAFLRKLATAVRTYQEKIRDPYSRTLWASAIESAKESGLPFETNGLISKDKILLAIQGVVVRGQNRSPESLIFTQAFTEDAWEYYQKKMKLKHKKAPKRVRS